MTTFALDQTVDTTATEISLERAEEVAPALPMVSVANPRRTTWTGYGKHATDRMPAL